jgi:hypothetical protein
MAKMMRSELGSQIGV